MFNFIKSLYKKKPKINYNLSSNSKVENSGSIQRGVIIENHSYIGEYATIMAYAYINNCKIGNHCTILNNVSISATETNDYVTIYKDSEVSNSKIGRCSYVGEGSSINYTTIGNFCSFGPFLIAGRGKHPTNYVSSSPVFFSTIGQCGLVLADQSYFNEFGTIEIGSDVWIGARVTIMEDIKIGHGAIIGAGAVVTKNVEPYSVVGGVPAKLIRKRFDDEVIDLLLKAQWWNYDIAKLKMILPMFQTDKVTIDLIKSHF